MSCETEETVIQAGSQTKVTWDLPEGVPRLRSLYLYASGSCNLACRHCWIVPEYRESSEDGRHIPLEYVEKAIREGQPLGLRSIKLTGGEPTLHPQFRELVALIAGAGLRITMETNGTLIDDDLAAFLKATPQFAYVSVSLDGVDATTHDALRGVRGSHARAINGIRALVQAGFRPQAICTLHKGNVGQMAAMVALGAELGCGSVKFNVVQDLGRGQEFDGEQRLDLVEILAIYRRVERELRPQSKVPVYFDIPLAFYSLPTLLRDHLGRCTVLNILGLLSSGDLSLCGIGSTVPELIYGHVARDDLREVWCSSPGLVELRAKVPAQLDGICANCLHRDICLGHCIAIAFHTTGRLNAPHPFCNHAEALGLFPASRKRPGE
ncbi:MAG: radical SAM protein [Chloroflexi bacterium]|nr:radical SAM protein [Chloroflexota bacterium]